MSFLYILGTLLGYILNKYFSFKSKIHNNLEWIKYCISYSIGYFLNFIILFYFVDFLNFPHRYVQLIAIIIVALLLFIMLRFFVFTKNLCEN